MRNKMMSDTKTKQLQKIVNAYMETGQPWPATTHQMAGWAISQKLWSAPPSAIIDECADQLARAMREEHIVDPQGCYHHLRTDPPPTEMRTH